MVPTEDADETSTGLARDLWAGLRVFVSLFWFHRFPRGRKTKRAVYIGLTLFGLMLGGMLYYWFTS
jgi:hypothetical protein